MQVFEWVYGYLSINMYIIMGQLCEFDIRVICVTHININHLENMGNVGQHDALINLWNL